MVDPVLGIFLSSKNHILGLDLEGTNKLDDNDMKATEYRNEQLRLSQGTRSDEKSFALGDSAPHDSSFILGTKNGNV